MSSHPQLAYYYSTRKKLVITAFIFQSLLEPWPASLLTCGNTPHSNSAFNQKLSKHFPKVSSNYRVWVLMGNQVTENTQSDTQPALTGRDVVGVVTRALCAEGGCLQPLSYTASPSQSGKVSVLPKVRSRVLKWGTSTH